MSGTTPMVHVLDDDAPTREAMQELFDSVSLPCRTYADAKSFLAALDDSQRGCIVLDLRLQNANGLDVQTRLREKHCSLPVIFLTGHGKVSAAVRAMHSGAADFLTKPVDDEALLDAVHAALAQDQQQTRSREERVQVETCLAALSPRESEVLDAVSRGLSNKEIARELEISPKTVELHRAHMMEKMQAHSIAEVVQMYLLVVGVEHHLHANQTPVLE